MKAVVQRVSAAQVLVAGSACAKIDLGLLVLVGIEQKDNVGVVEKFANKLLSFRIFPDQQGRMNLNVAEAKGALLVVSQFTLAAGTDRGNRPGFSGVADPVRAKALYESLVTVLEDTNTVPVQTGIFAADMQVSLTNEGPVTFTFEV